ncbi:DNA cytosine methyltransferase [Paenibacillus terrae]|uniref:DNA cytosine methyltransferase n=1 Tax=Paenibacillus terrae TaxID=159743 RepID=UPI0016568939|nr:DNA cytosine methyltransferase [Paenibacillus terrae]
MIANHDPKPLSDHVASKLAEGGYADYIRKHPIATLDLPSPAVLTQWAKGAPNGLVQPNGRETVPIRDYNVTPQLPPNGLTVAELFCGGGLMAVGLKSAGYTLTFANDFDKRAVQAYAHNIGDHVVCGDITDEAIQALIPNADIIAGGPPCQDYSVAGSGAGEEGERGKLVWTYLSIIERKQPKAFVFENVKGIITKRHRPTFDALLQRFDEIGYDVSWRLINAWDYGVAQKRERVFIVGIRKNLGFTFEFPEPRAEEYRTQVLRDVIGDLPEPNTGINGHVQTQATTVKHTEGVYNQRSYKADWEKPAKTVCTNRLDHAEIHPGPYNHNERKYTSVSPSKHDNPSLWVEPAKTIVASTTGGKNAFYPDNHDGHMLDNINPNWTYEKANRQASWETPGATVGDHARNEGVHPESKPQPRRFTVRECLRIQSVPDWYVLPDDISLSAQYRIVGNGVASRVSYLIGVALAEQLNASLAQDIQEAA